MVRLRAGVKDGNRRCDKGMPVATWSTVTEPGKLSVDLSSLRLWWRINVALAWELWTRQESQADEGG